jgi:NAD(P)H-quinone oxidoreductase subunit 5
VIPTIQQTLPVLGGIVVLAPLLLLAGLGGATLVGWQLSERTIHRAAQAAIMSGLLAAVSVLVLMLVSNTYHVVVDFGHWVETPKFHFAVKFAFDRLSVPLAILSFLLSGTIGAFASRYMHREPGYNRFFSLYALFVAGMVITSLADTIETLFTGWELVGLSSALLVAFFQERPAPSRNALWVWVIYRVSDAALLLAAVVLHHLTGEGDFDQLMGDQPWPFGHASLTPHQAFLVGGLLLLAAAGKSGLAPFSGWLPRAMEGPTPSSAIFYGALSVHLGAFLLLRISPILDASPSLSAMVVVMGLTTAIVAYLTGSVQTDIKSALSYASLTQVGLIVAEIGFGLRYLALIHLLGHACSRTLQFVRAPSLLADYHRLENALGTHLPRSAAPWERVSAGRGAWLYRLGLERTYFDALLVDYVALPFARFFRACDGLERRWTDFLSRGESRESDQVAPHFGHIEEYS